MPLSQASLTAALSPTIIDRFIEWRRDRRGGYTRAIEKPLLHIASFVHPKFGFLTQRTNFGRPQEPVAGLLTKDEAHIISHDRRGACEAVHRHVTDRIKELAKVTKDTKGRDPFEAILPVLEADEPWMEYHKIARQIRSRMPDDTYPVRKAEALRAIAMFRLNTQIGLRSKNWREMLFGERNNPRSWKELRRLKRGEIVFLDEVGWVIRIRREALKNASASHLTPTIQIKVLDIDGLHAEIERYISARPILLGEKKDPGVFFVKTRNSRSTSSEYNQAGFYNVWRAIITTYGIYNPWTDRGAIKGLRPHGPHAARHIIATDSVKDTGGFSDAARLLFDTEEMIRDNYARFLPGDAHARAQQRLLDRMVSRRTNGDIA